MHHDLKKLKTSMDIHQYTLKDLALYFERFDGYVCKINTSKGHIWFKFEASSLPHLIGMHYAFENRKDNWKYRGKAGFELLKNGKITYEILKHNVKNNKNKKVSWKNIDERIKFLPMFLNSLLTKSKLKYKFINYSDFDNFTHLKGNCFLYRSLHDGSFLIFSLKSLNKYHFVVESFVVDNDGSILKGLKEVKIISVELIAPLDNTELLTNNA